MRLTPVALPRGRARLATGPSSLGSLPAKKTIGIVSVAPVATKAPGSPQKRVVLKSSQVLRKCWQSVMPALSPAVFDSELEASQTRLV
jgi:hypothetical protein